MEYELDIDPDHLVEWLKNDLRSGMKKRFDVSANRIFVSEDFDNEAVSLDPEDEEVLGAAIGILEVKPLSDSGGHWLLRVRVEDIIGPHLPEQGGVTDEPEELSLEGFEADFIAPERGTAFVTLELDSEGDKALFESFLNDLRTDRH